MSQIVQPKLVPPSLTYSNGFGTSRPGIRLPNSRADAQGKQNPEEASYVLHIHCTENKVSAGRESEAGWAETTSNHRIWIHTESTWHHCEYTQSTQGAPTYCIGQLVPFCFMSLRSTISEGKPSLNYFVPDSKHKQLDTRLGHKICAWSQLKLVIVP